MEPTAAKAERQEGPASGNGAAPAAAETFEVRRPADGSVIETVEVDTPYGEPSAPPVVGSIGPYRVAFMPRHGRAFISKSDPG